MRFKKGTMVEVLYKEEVPSGSWRCAEIVAGNGHNYDVKYELPLCATGTKLVERVSRKQIRPCPPPVGGAVDWMPGDLVEVIDNTSWKIATILKVLGGSYITIKLFWSSQELRVHETCLRVRQSWKHDRWVVVGKGSVITEEGKSNRLSTSRFNEKSTCQLPVRVKKVKRKSPFAASQVKAYNESGWKIRAIEKDGRRQRMVPDHPSLFLEKVDAVASPQNVLGEKYMHASFNNRYGFPEMDRGRAKPNGNVGCFNERSLEPNNADSSESSVGSCSNTSTSPFRLPYRFLTNPSHDSDGNDSDAESFCGREYEKETPIPTKEELAGEIHNLELHAYRRTMEALFASGPLSWEQEELVTNLRLTLHISNDEHLMELRSLVSAETNLSIS